MGTLKPPVLIPFKCATKLAWAGRARGSYASAAPVHELVMPFREALRLDDLTQVEETACWQLAFARSHVVLQEKDIKAAVFMVNDGFPASQTVNQVHIHILGFSNIELAKNLPDELEKLTRKHDANFTYCQKEALVNEFQASSTIDDFRKLRQNLICENTNDTGYSI